MIKKKFLIFRFALINLFLLLILFAAFYFSFKPNALFPLSGMTILENSFDFNIQNGDEVLISTDVDFSSPMKLFVGDKIFLEPGLYYWKVRNKFLESEIRNFTIQERVQLDIIEGKNTLFNSGTVDLSVKEEKEDGIENNFVLKVGESVSLENDTDYQGGML